MDKLQEIKARISKLKGYENAKPTDQYWMAKEHIDFLIDRTELSVKQQEIIEENKRQQDVTVHQFRQAQEEIQRITKESDGFKQALEKIATLKPSTNNDINACNFQFAITTANLALEGDAE
ncbi:VWA domain-containing protein [Bacillus subtilis]|uniref:VWA domain-containing protein n=1 Tax=Bacillus subtilis TaxID=1423 RepID=UPI001C1FE7FE|nr:VWA domain-containing protein [Bacillus subtilis]QWV82757.1 VWA domain-containing protein [Bacillus subtilis subsp. subtilis]